MSEAEKRAWNIARKFLRELREATTSATTFVLEDVICGEFAKAARLQDERDHYKRALRYACLLSLPFGTEREVEERYKAALAATKEAQT